MKNPFTILGLTEDATQEQIKKAYRELSKQYHPDKNPQGEEKFKEISEAYDLINSEEKVKLYKNRGQAGDFIWDDEHFRSMFADFFGHGRMNRQKNTFVSITIPLEEFFTGVVKHFAVKVSTTCSNCGGGGATTFDQLGRPLRACDVCKGNGSTFEKRNVTVSIPRSIESGSTLHAENNVFVTVNQIPHERFERRAFNIVSREQIPLIKVFEGSDLTIQTLHGAVQLKLPKLLQNGQMLRIRGKGLYDFRKNSYGDHIIEITIVMPTNLTEPQCRKIAEILDGKEKTEKTGP